MKRLNQVDSLRIKTERNNYIVLIESLKNTRDGAPRFKAYIQIDDPESKSLFNAVYTFKGHYYGILGEARFIVEEYEKETRREEGEE